MIVPPDSEPFVFDENSGGDGLCVGSIRAITSSLGLGLTLCFPTVGENPYGSFNGTEGYSGFYGKLDRYELDLVCGFQSFYKLASRCYDHLPAYLHTKYPLVWVIPRYRTLNEYKAGNVC